MRRRDISSDVSRLRLNHRLNLSRPGFAGVLSYSLREALWLHEQNLCEDIVMGYPSVDRSAVRAVVADQDATRAR